MEPMTQEEIERALEGIPPVLREAARETMESNNRILCHARPSGPLGRLFGVVTSVGVW